MLGAPVLFRVWWLGSSRRAAEEQRVRAIDGEIAKARDEEVLRRIEASPAFSLWAAITISTRLARAASTWPSDCAKRRQTRSAV
jgi:hypothetical protein